MDAEAVEDPVFQQRYRFERDGDLLRVEMWTEPGGGVRLEHYHPHQEERFQVFEGEVTFTVDGEEKRAGPGNQLVANRGVPHKFENTGDGVAHLMSEASLAMTLQENIEEGAAMARAGRFNANGMPKGFAGLIEGADLAMRYREVTVLTSPPPVL